jgi:hypothetical protein
MKKLKRKKPIKFFFGRTLMGSGFEDTSIEFAKQYLAIISSQFLTYGVLAAIPYLRV